MTNRECLIEALKNGGDYESDIGTVSYISCPSSEDCGYDGGNDHNCCDECKMKWLDEEFEG